MLLVKVGVAVTLCGVEERGKSRGVKGGKGVVRGGGDRRGRKRGGGQKMDDEEAQISVEDVKLKISKLIR